MGISYVYRCELTFCFQRRGWLVQKGRTWWEPHQHHRGLRVHKLSWQVHFSFLRKWPAYSLCSQSSWSAPSLFPYLFLLLAKSIAYALELISIVKMAQGRSNQINLVLSTYIHTHTRTHKKIYLMRKWGSKEGRKRCHNFVTIRRIKEDDMREKAVYGRIWVLEAALIVYK